MMSIAHPRWQPCGNPIPRGYDKHHNAIRKAMLSNNPPCAICKTKPATVADHILCQALGGKCERSNYQALCDPCHRSKTGRELVTIRKMKLRKNAAIRDLFECAA
jgi:5-methylcytosine-specific restriction enzyme A